MSNHKPSKRKSGYFDSLSKEEMNRLYTHMEEKEFIKMDTMDEPKLCIKNAPMRSPKYFYYRKENIHEFKHSDRLPPNMPDRILFSYCYGKLQLKIFLGIFFPSLILLYILAIFDAKQPQIDFLLIFIPALALTASLPVLGLVTVSIFFTSFSRQRMEFIEYITGILAAYYALVEIQDEAKAVDSNNVKRFMDEIPKTVNEIAIAGRKSK